MLFLHTQLVPGPITVTLEGFKLIEVPLEGQRDYQRFALSAEGFADALALLRERFLLEQARLTSGLNDYRFCTTLGMRYAHTAAAPNTPWDMNWSEAFARALFGAVERFVPHCRGCTHNHIVGRTIGLVHDSLSIEVGVLPNDCAIRWQDRDLRRLDTMLEQLLFPALLAYLTVPLTEPSTEQLPVHGTSQASVEHVGARNGSVRFDLLDRLGFARPKQLANG